MVETEHNRRRQHMQVVPFHGFSFGDRSAPRCGQTSLWPEAGAPHRRLIDPPSVVVLAFVLAHVDFKLPPQPCRAAILGSAVPVAGLDRHHANRPKPKSMPPRWATWLMPEPGLPRTRDELDEPHDQDEPLGLDRYNKPEKDRALREGEAEGQQQAVYGARSSRPSSSRRRAGAGRQAIPRRCRSRK